MGLSKEIILRPYIAGVMPEPSINPSGALLMGLGNSTAQPVDSTADKNFLSFYLKTEATSGTSRGMYLRLYLASGAGGEALRAFATVSNAAPADTVNGAHISLNFGSSAGNVTGLGTAARCTLHLIRSQTGTLAPVQAEIYSDGSNAAVGGTMSFLRLVNDGHADGISSVNLGGYLMQLSGITDAGNGVAGMFRVAAPTTLAANLRILIGSTPYYIGLYSAPS